MCVWRICLKIVYRARFFGAMHGFSEFVSVVMLFGRVLASIVYYFPFVGQIILKAVLREF